MELRAASLAEDLAAALAERDEETAAKMRTEARGERAAAAMTAALAEAEALAAAAEAGRRQAESGRTEALAAVAEDALHSVRTVFHDS